MSDCALVLRVAYEIGVALGAMQVSLVWRFVQFHRDCFLPEDRQSPVVRPQSPRSGGLVGQDPVDGRLKTNRVSVRVQGIEDPIYRC